MCSLFESFGHWAFRPSGAWDLERLKIGRFGLRALLALGASSFRRCGPCALRASGALGVALRASGAWFLARLGFGCFGRRAQTQWERKLGEFPAVTKVDGLPPAPSRGVVGRQLHLPGSRSRHIAATCLRFQRVRGRRSQRSPLRDAAAWPKVPRSRRQGARGLRGSACAVLAQCPRHRPRRRSRRFRRHFNRLTLSGFFPDSSLEQKGFGDKAGAWWVGSSTFRAPGPGSSQNLA